MAFKDPESSINHYFFGMGDEEGNDNIYPFSYLPGTATRYLAKGTNLFNSVSCINQKNCINVDLHSFIYS